jgi:hypothetical protein
MVNRRQYQPPPSNHQPTTAGVLLRLDFLTACRGAAQELASSWRAAGKDHAHATVILGSLAHAPRHTNDSLQARALFRFAFLTSSPTEDRLAGGV